MSLRPASPKQQKALDVFRQVDVLILGGAMYGGKSWLAAMMATMYANDPNASTGVFRRTLGEMKNSGGIISTFEKVFECHSFDFGFKVANNPPTGKVHKGPAAGKYTIDFRQINSQEDLEKTRGAAWTFSLIEEAIPYFTEPEIDHIMARTRGNSRLGSKVVMTCNPHPDHYIKTLIEDYYLDENGDAIDERQGDIRYFMKLDGSHIWGESRDEVYKKVEEIDGWSKDGFSELTYEERYYDIINSFSFVQMTYKDNPVGVKNDPGYIGRMANFSESKRKREMFGNWNVYPETCNPFKRDLLRGPNGERVLKLSDIPRNCIAVRGVDKAHEEPDELNPKPDYTSISPMVLKAPDGLSYFIVGQFRDDIRDVPTAKDPFPIYGRFRRKAGVRDNLIVNQLTTDKEFCSLIGARNPVLVLAKDGAGGSSDYTSTVAKMLSHQITTAKDSYTASNAKGKKLLDFLGFCKAVEDGLVYIVEETFQDKSLSHWYTVLENFTGGKSSGGYKDDEVDSISMAFNHAAVCAVDYSLPAHLGFRSGSSISSGLINKRVR